MAPESRHVAARPEPLSASPEVWSAPPPRRTTTLARRTFLRGALSTLVGVPLALAGAAAVASADEGDEADVDHVLPAVAASGSQAGPGVHTYALLAQGPLSQGVTRNKYKHEIGFAAYDGDSFLLHLNGAEAGLGRSEWISRRIGQFSFRDGAVMVEARGELSPTGCFAIEMRHQAYKDRRYIRSNWLCLDPHDGHIHIQTDGIWNEMQIVADHHHDGYTPVRPPGEWNTFLFLASGDYLEGWVNGERAVAGRDGRWGSGNISLVALRIDRNAFRARFRNLRVWDGHLPDPASVW
jgi:hypothetical protein